MNGYYLSNQVRAVLVTYLLAFRKCVLEDILSVFENLDERAEAKGNEIFHEYLSQPAGEDFDGDASGYAEYATEAAQEYYDTMTTLRQASINLYAVGLFHVLEQKLLEIAEDASFEVQPRDSKLSVLVDWYAEYVGVQLDSLPYWQVVEELRLVANTIKHGEGTSAKQLKQKYPEYFENPILKRLGVHRHVDLPMHTGSPLGDGGVFVSIDAFRRLADGAIGVATAMQELLESHGDSSLPIDA